MIRYTLQRFLNGLAVLAGVIVVVFLLFQLIPVNSAQLTLGQRSDEQTLKLVEREFRLDQPVWRRMLLYVNDLSPLSLHSLEAESPSALDPRNHSWIPIFSTENRAFVLKKPYLGRSFQSRRKVGSVIAASLPPTMLLALSSILLASIFGIALGTFSALRQNSAADRFILVVTTLGISLPSYFAGLLIAMIFGYYLSDYTGLDIKGALLDLDDYGDPLIRWRNLVLPALALGIRPLAIFTQLTRSAVLDVKEQDYIRTAVAKGLPYSKVIGKHLLRNALNPVMTAISGWFATLLAGAFFIEIIFDFKGLGYQTVKAMVNFDFPLVMGAVLLFALIFILVNFLTDLLYGWLDPRISLK